MAQTKAMTSETPHLEAGLGPRAELGDHHIDPHMTLRAAHEPRHAEERGVEQDVLGRLERPAEGAVEKVASRDLHDDDHHGEHQHNGDDRRQDDQEAIVNADDVRHGELRSSEVSGLTRSVSEPGQTLTFDKRCYSDNAFSLAPFSGILAMRSFQPPS